MEKETKRVANNEKNTPNGESVYQDKIDIHITRAQRFFDAYKKRRNRASEETGKEETINNLIDEITPEDAMKVLTFLHKKLLFQNEEGRETYKIQDERKAIASSLDNGQQKYVAPTEVIQETFFKAYLEAIKKLKDKDQRALLAYYAINNLHFENDGNGRLSRAVYLLIKNDSILEDARSLLHKYDEDKAGRNNFLSKYHVRPAEQARAAAAIRLQSKLIKGNYIDKKFSKTCFSINSVLKSRAGLVQLQSWIMGEESYYQLDPVEHINLCYALSDGTRGEDYSTIAGLTLAMSLQRKGTLEKIAKENAEEDDRHVSFTVNHNHLFADDKMRQRAQSIFTDWQPEDFRRMISDYNFLKRLENSTLISIFTENERFDNGKKIVDWLMEK